MRDLIDNHQLAGHDPNTRGFTIAHPGCLLLDRQLRLNVQNPVPGNNRLKLHSREANQSRWSTGGRFPIECVFGGMRKQGMFNHRLAPTNYTDPIGDRFPAHPDIPVAEMLFNNMLCIFQKNHRMHENITRF